MFSTLNAVAPTVIWEGAILAAFQTWAAKANLNIGVVADNAALALGTGGAVQGDGRFGDIRIAAVHMAAGTLITNTSFQWSGTTWSGDVVINTAYRFSIGGFGNGPDLYTAMLNEAGNVLGVLDSRTDSSSAVYYQYAGPKSGLTSGDVADIQSQYGGRAPDTFDAASPNNTLAAATDLGEALTGVNLEADVTSTGDVDYYRFTLPRLVPAVLSFTAQVTTAGLSALAPSLDVYDSSGQRVGSDTSYDPFHGTASVGVAGGSGQLGSPAQVLGGSTYYVRVDGSTNTLFGVGGYKLNISYQLADGSIVGGLPIVGGLLNGEVGTDDLLALQSMFGLGNKSDARFDYSYRSSIASPSDVDTYQVKAATGQAGTQKMNVLVWALEQNGLHPKVEVYDADGNAVVSQLLANENGTFSVEVNNTTPGATYRVRISALGDGHDSGNYFLGVDYNTEPATAVHNLGSNTLTSSATTDVRAVTVTQNRLFEFILGADNGVCMQILDAGGNVVFSLSATAGQPASSGHVYLKAGNYTVRLTASACSTYTLAGRLISDPIGPRPDDGSSSSDPSATSWDGSSGTSSDPNWDQPYYW
jgi:hypothetical protein